MKLFLITFLGLSALAQAQYQERTTQYFLGGSYGIANEGSDSTDGYQGDGLFSLEMGAKFRNDAYTSGVLSVELLGSSYSDSASGYAIDADSTGVLVNGKFMYTPNPYVSFYIGGGIGVLNADVGLVTPTQIVEARESVFAYQGFVGVEFKPTPTFALYIQYRYLSGEDFDGIDPNVDIRTVIDDSYLDLGARFYF